MCRDRVTACSVTADAVTAGFSGWSGRGGLFIARQISQLLLAGCECTAASEGMWGKVLLNRFASSAVLSLLSAFLLCCHNFSFMTRRS